MNQSAINLRYLLWKEFKNREQWPIQLSQWIHSTPKRARQILDGAFLSVRELANIAEAIYGLADGSGRIDVAFAERIQHENLLASEQVNVLHENIRYLLEDSQKRGEKGKLAEKLNIDRKTLKRWYDGETTPQADNLNELRREFRIGDSIDLTTNPIFLNLTPVGDAKRRIWLKKLVDSLDADALKNLFPALEKLLSNT